MDYKELIEKIDAAVAANHAELIALNDDLADHPEVSGQEFETSRKIVELLRSHGYEVEYPFAGLPTAFKATFGKGGHKFKAALLAEYDALPEIGHACGHCVSGSISVIAGLGLKDFQDELDCDVDIIGTPIEETDGAKCEMVKKGVFDSYDMASMIHLYDKNLVYCKLLAIDTKLFTFHGRAAHSAVAPWEGVNALNAAQLFMHAVDCMRQHVTPDVRMHAVYRNGGAAPNIVPEEASVEIFTRALDRNYLNALDDKIFDMAKGACLMTGATYDWEWTSAPYDNLQTVPAGADALKQVFDELGIQVNGDNEGIFGSSDVGNVSFVCPTFQPTLQIVPMGTAIHTREFERAVKSDTAHDAIALGGRMLSHHIAKVFSDRELAEKMQTEFKNL